MTAYNQRMVIRGGRVISCGVQDADTNTILINDGSIEDIISADAVPPMSGYLISPGMLLHPISATIIFIFQH
jgi:hypothetical protein